MSIGLFQLFERQFGDWDIHTNPEQLKLSEMVGTTISMLCSDSATSG
jgi:hypothetical protein